MLVPPRTASRPFAVAHREHEVGIWARVCGCVLGLAIGLASTHVVAAPPERSLGAESDRSYRGVDSIPTAANAETATVTPAETDEPAPDDEGWDDEGDGDDEVWDDEEDDESWDDQPDDYDPTRDSPEAVEARRRIGGGVALIVVGSAAVLGGLAMGLSDPCKRPAGNSCSESARNRAALTMALPGVAVLAAGSVVLGLALRKRRRIQADVALSRYGGGLHLRGRF